MPYPSGVLLATVTVGDGFTESGNAVIASVSVKPNFGTNVTRIIWQASGQPLYNFTETFTAAGGSPVTFTLPFVNQAGFRDPAGNAFTMWSYTITVVVSDAANKNTVTYTQTLQPLTGQNIIDLDLLADTTPGAPTATNVPAVLSVNGQTGNVTVTGGGGGGAVDSVNGQTGIVVLDASSVGAVPTARTITTNAPITGGGALSGNLTLGLALDGVLNTHLANMAQATVKGRAAGAGTGDPQDLTQAQLMALLTAASDTAVGVVELATPTEVTTGTDTTRAVTPQGVAAAIAAVIGSSTPALLNTLDELANALGDDPNFATTMATALAAKVDENSGGFAVIQSLHPGSTLTVRKDPTTGFWPASYSSTGAPVYTGGSASAGVRPTTRSDVVVIWKGADPSPGIVASGSGGMIQGVDLRAVVL